MNRRNLTWNKQGDSGLSKFTVLGAHLPFFRNCGRIVFFLATSLTASAIVDTNSDGISDVWARAFQAEGLNSTDDEDDDGHTNGEEALAGTDPFDPESFLAPDRITQVNSGVELKWQGAENSTYRIKQSSTLSGNSWIPATDAIDGSSSEMLEVISKPSDPGLFFRIEATQKLPGDSASTLGLLHDTDGDGSSDLSEFFSGTDIFDSASALSITGIYTGDCSIIEWTGIAGKGYQLQTLVPGDGEIWKDLGLPVTAMQSGPLKQTTPMLAEGTSLRILPFDMDSDSDGASDWEEMATSFDPYRAITYTGRQQDAQEIENLLGEDVHYDLISRRSAVLTSGEDPGIVEIRRTSGFGPMHPSLAISGTALPGTDFSPLSDSIAFPFGSNSLLLEIDVLPTTVRDGTELIVSVGTAKPLSADSASTTVRFIIPAIISVKDYGAVGDGITDDTLAVQAALDALEATPSKNTLHFPTGKYRITKTYFHNLTGFTNWRILDFGFNSLLGRDIFFTGESGSVIFSDTGSQRAHMLMVQASFRSLSCKGLTWEKASTPLAPTAAGDSPNGADGISIIAKDGRTIEGITFDDCVFSNCHASIAIYQNSYDFRAKIRCLAIRDSQILNLYGANTVNSRGSWGGGQQVLVSPWVGTAIYNNSLFDGGGDDLTDQNTSPGGRLKDGCHFGSPQRLEFTNNTVRQMGVEAIFQTNTNTYIGTTTSSFTIPAADGSSTVDVSLNQTISSLVVGDSLNVRLSTTNSSEGTNTILRVVASDIENRILTLSNDDYPGNAAPGTTIGADRPIFLNREGLAAEVEISGNWVDYSPPPGASPAVWSAGIVANAKSRIYDNTVTGMQLGILIYKEVNTPVTPAARWSVIENNIVLTRDSANHSDSTTYGIQSYANDDSITDNFIITPNSYKSNGITTRGRNSWIESNTVISMTPADNGYSSPVRSVAIGIGNESNGARIYKNTSRGFDVGVGPINASQGIPHYVRDHQSVEDVLAVDHRGLIVD